MQPQKPIFLFIVAGLGIALAALGIFCKPLSIIGMFVDQKPVSMPFFAQPIEIPAAVRYVTAVSNAIGWIYAWALLAGGIGTYFQKPWARTTMIVYAVISILNNLGWLVLYLVGAMPLMQSAMLSSSPQPPPPAVLYMSMVIAGLCFVPFLIGFQVLVLTAYNLKSSKDFFAGRFPQQPVAAAPYAGVEYAQPAPYYTEPSQGYYPPQQQQGGYPTYPQYPQYPPQDQQPPYPGYGQPPPAAYPTDQNPPPPPPPNQGP